MNPPHAPFNWWPLERVEEVILVLQNRSHSWWNFQYVGNLFCLSANAMTVYIHCWHSYVQKFCIIGFAGTFLSFNVCISLFLTPKNNSSVLLHFCNYLITLFFFHCRFANSASLCGIDRRQNNLQFTIIRTTAHLLQSHKILIWVCRNDICTCFTSLASINKHW